MNGDNPFYWYGHYIIKPKGDASETMYTVRIKPILCLDVYLVTSAKMMYIDFTINQGDLYYLVAANYQALQPIFDNVIEINR